MVAQLKDDRIYAGVLTPDADLRQSLFGSQVMRHPAKQHLPQLAHIARRLQDYGIEPMSNILDCFGGAGSAMMLCSGQYGGHNVVTIELAAHFRALQAAAWQHFQCSLDMADIYGTPPGVFVSLAGDSREIPLVLFAANHDLEYVTDTNGLVAPCIIVTFAHLCQQLHAILEEAKRFFARQELLARFAEAGMCEGEYLDVVVTSPPYHNSLSDTSDQRERRVTKARETGHEAFPYRVGKYSQVSLRNGYVDAVVTSPPYADALSQEWTHRRSNSHERDEEARRRTGNNCGPKVRSYTFDAVITSPSYGGSEAVDKRDKQNATIAAHGGGNAKRRGYMGGLKTPSIKASRATLVAYDAESNADNIGNESGARYLASMAQVWQGAAAVLRPGGILVCITRDCVKQGKRVPVGEQNRALIEAAGLVFVDVDRWHVERQSFWRILQQRKNPDAPIIDEEDVMFFVKPEEADNG